MIKLISILCFSTPVKRVPMVWTEEHDKYLCREIITIDPFDTKKGTVQRSAKWSEIASALSAITVMDFKVDKR